MSTEDHNKEKRKIAIRPAGLDFGRMGNAKRGHYSSVLNLPSSDQVSTNAETCLPVANDQAKSKSEVQQITDQKSSAPESVAPNENISPMADVSNSSGTVYASSSHRRSSSRSPKPVGLYLLILLLSLIIAACLFAIYQLADSFEAEPAKEPSLAAPSQADVEPVVVTPEQRQMIDVAMIKLRGGDAEGAIERFKILQSDNPGIPSLDYLTALAALQAGDIELASSSVETSIAKGERVSDALALSAALESMKSAGGGWQAMGDLRARAEYYLHQAIEADTANPSPYIELAMRLRSRGENAEARKMLEAARARINPVDSFAILDTTLLLIRLQELPDDQLPDDLDPDKDIGSLMGSAYVALRRGDFTAAAYLLQTAKKRLPTDLYFYLLGDPELRKYATEPQLAPLFQ